MEDGIIVTRPCACAWCWSVHNVCNGVCDGVCRVNWQLSRCVVCGERLTSDQSKQNLLTLLMLTTS